MKTKTHLITSEPFSVGKVVVEMLGNPSARLLVAPAHSRPGDGSSAGRSAGCSSGSSVFESMWTRGLRRDNSPPAYICRREIGITMIVRWLRLRCGC